MKTLINTALPALALLALGGCATTGAVSSTEPDDVYFSSKDRVTYAAPAARPGYQSSGYQPNGYGSASTQAPGTAQTPATEDANPDYQGDGTQAGTSTDYYDDNYTSYNSVQPSGFGQPYTGPGVSTYNYTPSWSVSPAVYGSPFGYGAGLSMGYGYGGFGGYSPFSYGYGYPAYGGFYDPFYSPFYSPFGYGSGLSIGFGYGFGRFGGYPFYGGGFGSPYRYGGGYGYPGYAYGGGYGGGYGYGGDYGGYGGARNYVYKQGIMNGQYANGYDPGAIKVGRRGSRYADAATSGNMVNPGGGGAVPAGTMSNRRAIGGANSGFDRVAAPGGNMPTVNGATNGQPATMDRARRFDQNTMNANSPGGVANGAYNQPRSEATNPAAAQPQRRGGFFREVFANPNPNNGAQPQGQNNGYSQPQRRSFDQQRAFSQPQQQQRSFDQQRSFSQPRMEQRSYSPAPAPSFGGGGGGGGSFGGGGGGGGGRRGR